jgi:hypothetical protein
MSNTQCQYCGLSNFAGSRICSGCGNLLAQRPTSTKNRRVRPRISLLAVLAFAIGILILYNYWGGFEPADKKSGNGIYRRPVESNDKNAGVSRTESDRQRAGTYGTALQNSNSLSESKRHNDEVNKAIHASQGTAQK